MDEWAWSPHKAFFLLHKEHLKSHTVWANLCAALHCTEDSGALGYNAMIIGTVVSDISDELPASILKVQGVQVV